MIRHFDNCKDDYVNYYRTIAASLQIVKNFSFCVSDEQFLQNRVHTFGRPNFARVLWLQHNTYFLSFDFFYTQRTNKNFKKKPHWKILNSFPSARSQKTPRKTAFTWKDPLNFPVEITFKFP